MQEKVLDFIRQYVNSLSDLGVSKSDIAEIMDKLTSEERSLPKKRELLNKKQVAQLAKVNPRTVDRWVDAGKLSKRIICNNSVRFDSEDVERFLFG